MDIFECLSGSKPMTFELFRAVFERLSRSKPMIFGSFRAVFERLSLSKPMTFVELFLNVCVGQSL